MDTIRHWRLERHHSCVGSHVVDSPALPLGPADLQQTELAGPSRVADRGQMSGRLKPTVWRTVMNEEEVVKRRSWRFSASSFLNALGGNVQLEWRRLDRRATRRGKLFTALRKDDRLRRAIRRSAVGEAPPRFAPSCRRAFRRIRLRSVSTAPVPRQCPDHER